MNTEGTVDRALHPLLEQLVSRHGFVALTADTLDDWAASEGAALLLFVEDPARLKETLDVAVIAPELLRAFPGTFRAAVLMPEAARAVAVRYGVRRWPAFVVLRGGGYVGAVEGLRNWSEYIDELTRLATAPVMRAPSIGVAVSAPSGGNGCH